MIEERILINAPASTIFAIYADVERWNTWDPDTKSSSLGGSFAVGATGHIEPAKGQAVKMTLVEVTQDRSFSVVGAIPGFSMRFDHELTERGGVTEAVHRVTFSGFLRFIFGPLVGAQVRKGLPKTMLSLKAKAEEQLRV
ncbi:SRPBCC family protein [Variovorax sp. PCZ-1]|uniref:SRPBCC family protein n=1 Tax=Variovorax sp. PCZ-1 TaxID=2835533 RepID=UPI001BD192BB|nr:SRPBCC family protein [Variovorax sp. PCZ-1]MBS7807281.1 SRPBCC family protein [Variovorax sp. PCZ-1]